MQLKAHELKLSFLFFLALEFELRALLWPGSYSTTQVMPPAASFIYLNDQKKSKAELFQNVKII
jgi:hypothetical protein